MKKFNKSGPTRLRRVLGNLHNQRRILPTLAVAAGLLTASSAFGTEINLVTGTTINGVAATTSGSFTTGTVPGGSGTIYELIDTHPAGTGVFQPFLSYQHKTGEEGVNTSNGGNGQGVLDDKRVPQWTHDLHLGDLGTITRNGVSYYAFELDANETGSGQPNRLLSIDNIRIFTSVAAPFANAGNDSAVRNIINGATPGGANNLVYAQNTIPNTTDNYTS